MKCCVNMPMTDAERNCLPKPYPSCLYTKLAKDQEADALLSKSTTLYFVSAKWKAKYKNLGTVSSFSSIIKVTSILLSYMMQKNIA